VFATVGTDHHPFDRLVGWIDRWAASHAAAGVAVLVQTGTSARPRWAQGRRYLGQDEMAAAIAEAAAVVTHGGPGTIMLCCNLGKRPIVVPRLSALGEHVDDHQVLFSRRLAVTRRVEVAESEEALVARLDAALERAPQPPRAPGDDHVAQAVRRFGELVAELFPGSPAGSPHGG
jgi:UDP-N-acetylglucosamine transferase subunit ALG13